MTTDPRYVAARSVLLDALEALDSHLGALVVVGAQAIYLRVGADQTGIAPFTTDGDLAIDPELLSDEPVLGVALMEAGFSPLGGTRERQDPGRWVRHVEAAGTELAVSVDLIVPEDASTTPGGRRGARLGPHGNRAAHRARGLEPALVDRGPLEIAGLVDKDPRTFTVNVAGPAALLVAKAHKIQDRLTEPRQTRVVDKDGGDVYRLMQRTSPDEVGSRLAELRHHPMAGAAATRGVEYLTEQFARRGDPGIAMAVRTYRAAIAEAQIIAVATSYVRALNGAIAAKG